MNEQEAIEQLLDVPAYALSSSEKRKRMLSMLNWLSQSHYRASPVYQNVIDGVFGGESALQSERLEDIPFFPVSLFKSRELRSVPSSDVRKVLTSSGTTGQAVSRVYLDSTTAKLQSAVLVKIMQHHLGTQRLPMIVLDHKSVIQDRRSFSARGAGTVGMMQFGRRPFYALHDDMSLDIDGLLNYIGDQKKLFLFGFTFMVWKYVVLALERTGIQLNLDESIMVHSGGWKKLIDLRVSTDEFRRRVAQTMGISNVLNFYGMVEQVGSIYLENNLHYLHASNFSDIIIRDPITLKPQPPGSPGLVQVLSMLPLSYPGHSILTEDLGIVHGEDNPATGLNGRYFEILGRVPKSELRGCSDTFQI